MKKLNSASILSILFLLGILVMINAIGIRYFLRADLTSSKIYSLSKSSKTVVSKLNDKVLIKVYFSPNLPSPLNTNERYLRDMLEDYRAFSHGKLRYEFVKPDDEKKFTEEAENFGIPPRQIKTVANDKFEVKMAYMGLVVIFRDKKETLPVIENTDNLEYELTSLIKRLSATKNPILGIASTSTGREQVTMQKLYESLGRNYNVQPINLDQPIDKSVNSVLVLAPRAPFTDKQLYTIDQYIMNGGKVGMFMNSYMANLNGSNGQQPMGVPFNLNINKLLNNYGIGLEEDMVIDVKCNSISSPAQQGFIKFMQTFQIPFMPIIQGFNKANIITRDLQQVPTFFPSSVDTTLAKGRGYKVEGLLYSSDFSGRKTGPVVYITPLNYMKKTDFISKGIPVAAIVSGKFTSLFAQTGAPRDSTGGPIEPLVTACAEENRLLLCGDGNMALDSYVQDPRQTLFIQNAADWL
ncbi:MAG: GldG family protein, partial [Candidatus Latescibacterota bacterium]